MLSFVRYGGLFHCKGDLIFPSLIVTANLLQPLDIVNTALYKYRMKIAMSIRIDEELKARLDKVCDASLYAPSRATVIERGIVLALKELERKKWNKARGDAVTAYLPAWPTPIDPQPKKQWL